MSNIGNKASYLPFSPLTRGLIRRFSDFKIEIFNNRTLKFQLSTKEYQVRKDFLVQKFYNYTTQQGQTRINEQSINRQQDHVS